MGAEGRHGSCSHRRLSFQQLVEDADVDFKLSKEVKDVPCYIIMPFHRWKSRWDLSIMGLVLLSSFLIPFDIAYRDLLDGDCGAGGTCYLSTTCTFGFFFDFVDLLLTFLFVLDLVFSGFVSYQDENNQWQVTAHETIRYYVRTWLIVDMFAVIPFDLMVEGFCSEDSSLGALGMFKAMRLLRLGKLLKTKQTLVTSTRAVGANGPGSWAAHPDPNATIWRHPPQRASHTTPILPHPIPYSPRPPRPLPSATPTTPTTPTTSTTLATPATPAATRHAHHAHHAHHARYTRHARHARHTRHAILRLVTVGSLSVYPHAGVRPDAHALVCVSLPLDIEGFAPAFLCRDICHPVSHPAISPPTKR